MLFDVLLVELVRENGGSSHGKSKKVIFVKTIDKYHIEEKKKKTVKFLFGFT